MRLPGVLGWMAERSKALVLGTILFGGVCSNPTPIIRILFLFSTKEFLPLGRTGAPCSQRIGAAEAR